MPTWRLVGEGVSQTTPLLVFHEVTVRHLFSTDFIPMENHPLLLDKISERLDDSVEELDGMITASAIKDRRPVFTMIATR